MKNIIKIIAAFAIIAMTFLTASAAETTTKSEIKLRPHIEKKMQINEQQKALMEKWDKLSDAQKNEIYAITDQIALLKQDIVDKLYDFKLLDDNMAKKLSTLLIERNKKLKDIKRIPMIGYKFAQ